ncbi:MAG: adenosine-specific kinase [Candidatus Micrarchaeia archaeon]
MAEIKIVKVAKDDEDQIIIGHAGFIKTAEDLYEAMMNSVPGIKFGVAFAEASGKCLVRGEGNDSKLIEKAEKNALSIGAGHTFVIIFRNGYPINVANALKNVPEVVSIYCATANNVSVAVMDTGTGRVVLGIADGEKSRGIEGIKDKKERRKQLRDFGYKLSD